MVNTPDSCGGCEKHVYEERLMKIEDLEIDGV